MGASRTTMISLFLVLSLMAIEGGEGFSCCRHLLPLQHHPLPPATPTRLGGVTTMSYSFITFSSSYYHIVTIRPPYLTSTSTTRLYNSRRPQRRRRREEEEDDDDDDDDNDYYSNDRYYDDQDDLEDDYDTKNNKNYYDYYGKYEEPRQGRRRSSYIDDDDNNNDDYSYYNDDDVDSNSRYYNEVGNSKEEMELRQMSSERNANSNKIDRYRPSRRSSPSSNSTIYDDDEYDYSDSEYDDDYYNDVDDKSRRSSSRRKTRDSRYEYYDDYDDEEEYYVDDVDDNNKDSSSSVEEGIGNFWSNPLNGLDPYNPLSPPPRRNRRDDSNDFNRRTDRTRERRRSGSSRNSKKRSSFRSGPPPPPPPVRGLYDRLFWYGFDPAESTGVGDKTMFGGTKGKFSGLSYLQDGEDAVRQERNRVPRGSLPPAKQQQRRPREDDDDLRMGDDYYYDNDGDEGERRAERSEIVMSEGSRAGRERSGQERSDRRQQRRRQGRRRRDRDYEDDDGDEDSRDDWLSKQVSSWFDGGSSDGAKMDDRGYNYEDEDDDFDGRSSRERRRLRKKESEWSPMSAVNTFLGIDNERMKYQAAMYDENMGLNRSTRNGRRTSQNRPKRPDSSRRRPGYAYPYDPEEEGEGGDSPLDAYDVTAEPVQSERKQSMRKETTDNNPQPPKKERSWEERALAAERIPPSVPAWGPSGALGIDARTKAIQDALEDVQTARQKVERREKKEIVARESLTILRVDAELLKKRLESGPRQGAWEAQETLRQIELEIDDASRNLRLAKSQLQAARDQLEELEDRHWALLSQYNIKQAGDQVSSALKELEELEPAARLDSSGGKFAKNSSDSFSKEAAGTATGTTASSPLFGNTGQSNVSRGGTNSGETGSGSTISDTRNIASDNDSV